MTLVTKPTSLSADALSDYTHITSFYDQLTDGASDIIVASVSTTGDTSVTELADPGIKFILEPISVTGTLFSGLINTTMESSGYLANDYPRSIVEVYNTNAIASQLVQSVQTSSLT